MRESSKLIKQLSSCFSWSSGVCVSVALALCLVFFFVVFEIRPGSPSSEQSWVSSTVNPWISTSTTTKNASSSPTDQEIKKGYVSDVVGVVHDDHQVQEVKRNESFAVGILEHQVEEFKRNDSSLVDVLDHQVEELKKTDSSAVGVHDQQVKEVKRNDSSVVIKHQESINNIINVNGSDEIYIAPISTRARKEYSKLERLEVGLSRARFLIAKSARNGTHLPDQDYTPRGPIYRNAKAFQRSYLEMEKSFKVFVYEEGDPPIFHTAGCKSIYAMEGIFINQLEVNKFRTRNAEKAQVFFLPFSIVMMVHFIFEQKTYDSTPFDRTINDFINIISHKYPYWNRSLGADHFMVSCHDWAPDESAFNSYLYNNSIRVLCNANVSEGFNPSKDATLPEIHLLTGEMARPLGGLSPSKRSILAFFAGRLDHGPIRPILSKHWKGKDTDVQVYDYLPKTKSYNDMMKKSRYCLCPSGYEVASPRVAESLYTGCVPVLISEAYVPPFSDVLNWNEFSVTVPPSEIPNLKNILMSIPQRRYIKMQRRGMQVRRHFEVNSPPKRFDVFHMLLHSVWLRRLNIRIHDDQ